MKVSVLVVPDSAGAYCVGVERAPDALRDAGLIEELAALCADVHDAGDLPMRRWTPDRSNPLAQNVATEAEVLIEIRDSVAVLLQNPGTKVLVLGGSCTVAVGVCSHGGAR